MDYQAAAISKNLYSQFAAFHGSRAVEHGSYHRRPHHTTNKAVYFLTVEDQIDRGGYAAELLVENQLLKKVDEHRMFSIQVLKRMSNVMLNHIHIKQECMSDSSLICPS